MPHAGCGNWTRWLTGSASRAPGLKHFVEAGAGLDRSLCRMIDVPEETHRDKTELGRLTTRGRSIDDGSGTTLLLVHETDGSWSVHGLGAGVTLAAGDMVALATAVLERARVARPVDKWRDVNDTHIPDQCRVQQVAVAKLHGALPCRLGKFGRVVGRGFTRIHVQFDSEPEATSLRPHLMRVIDPATSQGAGPGVTLPAADTVTLAESILERCR